MPNYFDYISEATTSSVDDIRDDFDNDTYNEMDATMCEFDSYVQESVGIAIAASVGGAALLGGLIALLVKCFGKSSPSSAAKATKAAKNAVDTAMRQGAELPENSNVLMLTNEAIDEKADEVIESLDQCIEGTHDLIVKAKEASGGGRKPTRSEKARARKEAKKAEKTNKQNAKKNRVSSMSDMSERYGSMYIKSIQIANKESELKKLQRDFEKGEKEGWITLTDEEKKQLTQLRANAGKMVAHVSQEFVADARPAINKPSWVREVRDKRQPQ